MKTTETALSLEATANRKAPASPSARLESLSRWHRWHREFDSLAFSVLLHMGVLLIMACFALPIAVTGHSELNAVFATGEEGLADELLLGRDAVLQIAVESENLFSVPEPTTELPVLDIASIQHDIPTTIEHQTLVSPSSSAESSCASSVEEAVKRVAGGIHGRLQDGDLLVVWLLDASHSMVDSRQRLARELETFFTHLVDGEDSHHELLNAVVSFGAAMKERVAPTELRAPILNSVREFPVDSSGEENVFAAIQQCVSKYRRYQPERQLLIMVWTDESGDDATKLENTIRICQRQAASVSVIGPSAVLGAASGLRPFTDPRSGQVRQLPVQLGPDSAMPERLDLAYWFLTQEPPAEVRPQRGFRGADLPTWYGSYDPANPDYKCMAALEVPLPSWYGGRDLKGIVSGFGPYALTRLTLQTGGTYTIFDQEEDRGPFRPEAMQGYRPDYRSIQEYVKEVQSHPLRHAVMDAVQLLEGKHLGPPPTMLFGQQSESPPYGFMRTYFTSAKFVVNLKKNRVRLKEQADRASRIVEHALARVGESGSVEKGLEGEYQEETSRRWRAWYDLTRGRLLATSVRLEEYRLACDAVVEPGFLDQTTNYVIFVPALEMTAGSKYRRRAEEAEHLLTRCVRDNANTPWAWLAQRELEYGLGIQVRQQTLVHSVMPRSSVRQAYLPRL